MTTCRHTNIRWIPDGTLGQCQDCAWWIPNTPSHTPPYCIYCATYGHESKDCWSTQRVARLDEYDATEWFDICRKLCPALTQEDFDTMWDNFQRRKAEGRLQPN
jgi:hypothetical protein